MEGFSNLKDIAVRIPCSACFQRLSQQQWLQEKTRVPTIVVVTPFGSLTKHEGRFHLVSIVTPTSLKGFIGVADAFVGGLVAASCWGRPMHEALVWGHTAASLCLEVDY